MPKLVWTVENASIYYKYILREHKLNKAMQIHIYLYKQRQLPQILSQVTLVSYFCFFLNR